MAMEKTAIWSGFWARLVAWIADIIVLGVICYGIGMMGIDYFATLGSTGRVFGLVLGIVYFGITASGPGGGRSLGMRALGLKVVRLDGRPLGLPAAFGRAGLLVAPLMLNGWYFNVQNAALSHIIGVVALTAVFGICLAQIYLLLFNGPTRRLVHDLVFGSVVVRADAQGFEVPKGRAHSIVASVLILIVFGLSLAAPTILRSSMPRLQTMVGPLQRVQGAVNALPDIRETSVLDNTTWTSGPSGPPTTTHTLVVTARVRHWPADPYRTLARIGAASVKAYTFAPGQRLMVKIVYGFDLGFAAYNNAQWSTFSTQCTTPDVKCLAQ
jgi:uncharacterized RDD family membrane protein YckC